jgi:hypothetical protein
MIDIFCVWVKPKYEFEDVWKLYAQCKQHINVPFRFVCLTDRYWIREPITFYDVSKHQLDTWWNKLLIFDPQYGENGIKLYFDLDVDIKGDITHLIDQLQHDKLLVVNTPWKNNKYFKQKASHGREAAFLEYGNSSVMGWCNDSHKFLLDMFNDDIFKHTSEHFGDDTFINRNGNIGYFKCKIFPESHQRDDAEIVISLSPKDDHHKHRIYDY